MPGVTRSVFVVISLSLLAAGCKTFNGFYTPPKYFKFGTTVEQEFSKSMHHTVGDIKQMLGNRNIGVRRIEPGDATTLVWAKKDGIDYVFDVKSLGEESCLVHVEIDQPGNDQIAWSLMQDLLVLP